MSLSSLAGSVRLVSLTLGLVLAPFMAHAKEPAVLVLPLHGKAGVAFDGAVGRLVQKPLSRHAAVVSPLALRAAMRRTHLRTPALYAPKNVIRLGRATGADFVLIIEAAGARGHLAANTSLIDLGTGKTVFSDHFALPGGRLSAEAAAQVLSPVLDKLLAINTPSDSEPVAATPAKAGRAVKSGAAVGTDDADDSHDAAATEAALDSDEDSGFGGTERGPRWRPALHFGVGMFAMRREATTTASGGQTPPCYCSRDGKTNPFFVGPALSLDVFPWAFTGNGENPLEGLGLHADTAFSVVRSHVGSSGEQFSSTVYNVKVGPTYRLVWWSSPTSPETSFTAGYSVYGFPLSKGAFPGLSYQAPFVSLNAVVPLGMQMLALVAGGTAMFPLSANAGGILGKQSGGFAYNVEGGLRFAYDRFDVTALARYNGYQANYTGATAFAGDGVTQFSNVGLSERNLQFLLMAGISF